jgi:hypothetical protein
LFAHKPGRNDWVIGRLDVHPERRGEVYRFSCSVDFNSGRVRTADIDPRVIDWETAIDTIRNFEGRSQNPSAWSEIHERCNQPEATIRRIESSEADDL